MSHLDSRSCFLFLLCFSTCMRMSQRLCIRSQHSDTCVCLSLHSQWSWRHWCSHWKTLLISASKSAAVFTAAVPRPVTAAVTGRNFLPTFSTDAPRFWSFSPASSILASVALVVAAWSCKDRRALWYRRRSQRWCPEFWMPCGWPPPFGHKKCLNKFQASSVLQLFLVAISLVIVYTISNGGICYGTKGKTHSASQVKA